MPISTNPTNKEIVQPIWHLPELPGGQYLPEAKYLLICWWIDLFWIYVICVEKGAKLFAVSVERPSLVNKPYCEWLSIWRDCCRRCFVTIVSSSSIPVTTSHQGDTLSLGTQRFSFEQSSKEILPLFPWWDATNTIWHRESNCCLPPAVNGKHLSDFPLLSHRHTGSLKQMISLTLNPTGRPFELGQIMR